MRLAELVATSAGAAATSARLEKVARLAALLARLPPEEIEIAAAFLSGSPRQGRIGIGGAVIGAARDVRPADTAALELREVDAAFDRIATASGAGSSTGK